MPLFRSIFVLSALITKLPCATALAVSIAATLLAPAASFAQIEVVTEVHRTALEVVRQHKMPPPLAAWSFAIANVSAQQAFEASQSSWLAYRTAFYRTWSMIVEKELPALTRIKESIQTNQQKEEIRIGMTAATSLMKKYRLNYQAAIVAAKTSPDREFMGDWRPTPPAFAPPLLPNWGSMRLWGTMSHEELQKGLTPLDWRSSASKRELLEVVSMGDANSTERTPDQTQMATFWAAEAGTITPPGMWIEIALTLLESARRTPREAASTMLILSQALSDSGVSCWNLKYAHSVWRPISAIRDLLPGHRDWEPLLESPPFPGYVSGHSTFSAAAATVLQTLLKPGPITARSEAHPGVVRKFSSLWAAAEEAGKSRVFGGIHFESDNRDGLELGHLAGCSALKRAGINTCQRYVQY
jgi:membrane-associated phospholipid phosphatase